LQFAAQSPDHLAANSELLLTAFQLPFEVTDTAGFELALSRHPDTRRSKPASEPTVVRWTRPSMATESRLARNSSTRTG
jgi:hypothetical protein